MNTLKIDAINAAILKSIKDSGGKAAVSVSEELKMQYNRIYNRMERLVENGYLFKPSEKSYRITDKGIDAIILKPSKGTSKHVRAHMRGEYTETAYEPPKAFGASGAKYDLCVVGGFGHVGLPLSIAFASRGLKVCAFDIAKGTYDMISKGQMPFIEYGAEPVLKKVLENHNLVLSLSEDSISESKIVLIVIGTPIDYRMSPVPAVEEIVEKYLKRFRNGQLLVLRSTLHPGTTERIGGFLKSKGLKIDVAYCPERLVQGQAMKELLVLPQVVSSTTKSGEKRAADLFKILTRKTIITAPKEAELSKLFANAWRYIKFSAANQFFMICNDMGIDYYKVHRAVTEDYLRAEDLPGAGFAAGPCLYKDTAHLSAFYNYNFSLGNSAMMINEGLPSYVVSRLKINHDLKKMNVGILGMAFKKDIDDKRDSLSYKLKDVLELNAKNTYCSDVYIKDPSFLNAKDLVKKSDIIILAAPHHEYAKLKIPKGKTLVDIWNFYGKGSVA